MGTAKKQFIERLDDRWAGFLQQPIAIDHVAGPEGGAALAPGSIDADHTELPEGLFGLLILLPEALRPALL